jgi:hypothetical protein
MTRGAWVWFHCSKFLTLRFGCEQEEVLGFQGRTFSPFLVMGVYARQQWRQGKGMMEMWWCLWP